MRLIRILTLRVGALINRDERRSTVVVAASKYDVIDDSDLPSSLNIMQALSKGTLNVDELPVSILILTAETNTAFGSTTSSAHCTESDPVGQ